MKKQLPTDVAGWSDRAIEHGWARDQAKRIDLSTFEERLALVPEGKLCGVRVDSMNLEAWWLEPMIFAGVGRDGQATSSTIERMTSTTLHHVPPAASRMVDRNIEIDARPWCPAHAFTCRPSKERGCGYNCLGRSGCDCSACEFSHGLSGVELEKKLGLVHISKREHLRSYIESMNGIRSPGWYLKKTKKIASAKTVDVKIEKKKLNAERKKVAQERKTENISRQVGLLASPK